jgi:hypothetical protein
MIILPFIKNFIRLLKNAHLRRYPHSSSLRRTSLYASILGISDASHLDLFDQPAYQLFFSNLLVYHKCLQK